MVPYYIRNIYYVPTPTSSMPKLPANALQISTKLGNAPSAFSTKSLQTCVLLMCLYRFSSFCITRAPPCASCPGSFNPVMELRYG